MASKYIRGTKKEWPQVSAKVPPEVEDEIRELANATGEGMSEVIREALTAGGLSAVRDRVGPTDPAERVGSSPRSAE